MISPVTIKIGNGGIVPPWLIPNPIDIPKIPEHDLDDEPRIQGDKNER